MEKQKLEPAMPPNDVQVLKESLEKLSNQFSAFAETQDQMLSIISGNPLDKNDSGMIGDVSRLKHDVSSLKQTKNKAYWFTAGVVGIITIIWAVINFLK